MEGPMWKKQMRRLSDNLDAVIVERDAAISRAEDLKSKLEDLFKKIRSRLCMVAMAIALVSGDDLIKDGIFPDRNFGDKLHARRVDKLKRIERGL